MIISVDYGTISGGGGISVDITNIECIGNATGSGNTYTFTDIPETKDCLYAIFYGSAFSKGTTYNLSTTPAYPLNFVQVDGSGNCSCGINVGTSEGSGSISGNTLTYTSVNGQGGKANVGLFRFS